MPQLLVKDIMPGLETDTDDSRRKEVFKNIVQGIRDISASEIDGLWGASMPQVISNEMQRAQAMQRQQFNMLAQLMFFDWKRDR